MGAGVLSTIMSLALLVMLIRLVVWWLGRSASATSLTGWVYFVIDGDTIIVVVNGQRLKVRYLGMNCPEVTKDGHYDPEPGALEAWEANKKLVDGKTIRMDLDLQRFDKYGRLLAYVYVGDRMVNVELLRQGYAQVMKIPPNVKFASEFRRLERQARKAQVGLWQ
jgi:micrococcal nuclease